MDERLKHQRTITMRKLRCGHRFETALVADTIARPDRSSCSAASRKDRVGRVDAPRVAFPTSVEVRVRTSSFDPRCVVSGGSPAASADAEFVLGGHAAR
jgi:hypothetical protein